MWNKTDLTNYPAGKCVRALLIFLLAGALLAGCGQGAADSGSDAAGSVPSAASVTESGTGTENAAADFLPKAAPGEEQTVTVKTEADGTVKKITITRGEDEPEEEAGTDTLPFKVRISYFLDGKEMRPEEMAGKSGHVRIRFDYENLSETAAEGRKTIVPFAFLSVVFLPEEHFANVTVENGETASFKDNTIAYGYALPGWKDTLELAAFEGRADELTEGLADLEIEVDTDEKGSSKKKESDRGSAEDKEEDKDRDKEKNTDREEEKKLELELPEYVGIEADATDFRLEFAATVVTNGLLADMKEDMKDGLADLSKAAGAFGDAGEALLDGTKELSDGAEEFRGYLKTYIDGTTELAQGLNSVLEAVTPYAQGALAADLTDLLDGINTEQVLSDIRSVQQNGQTVLAGVDQLTAVLAEAAPILEENGIDLSSVDLAAIRSAAADLTAQASKAEEALGGLDKETLDHMLWEAYGQLRCAQDQLRQLAEGASSLKDGTAQLVSAGPQLLEGYDALSEGIGALRDGTEEFQKKGLSVIADLFGDEFGAVRENLWRLHLADAQYRAHGVYDGKEGSVLYILEAEGIG